MDNQERSSCSDDCNSVQIGFITGGIPNVSPAEAFDLCESGAVIIDLRADYMTAFKKFGVDRVEYLSVDENDNDYSEFPKNRTLIVAETSTSVHSRMVVASLIEYGFKNVYNLAGGFVEWERDGFPVYENRTYRLSGSCACQLKPRESKI